MTYATFPLPDAARRPLLAEPVFGAVGILIGLSLAVTLTAQAIDPRPFAGDSVWVKPIKFQVALSLYLLTLSVFARWLPAGMTARPAYRIFAAFVVFSILAELAWIGGAAFFGTASHFNVSSPLMATLYGLMGFFAVSLTSASLVYGIAIWRNSATGLAPALRLSIALGLVLTFVLTVLVAGTMASLPGHLVGTAKTGASLPIFGWSREVGDLRLPHFFASHAMHVLPVLGWAAARFLPPAMALPATWLAAIAFTGSVLLAFGLALSGLPIV